MYENEVRNICNRFVKSVFVRTKRLCVVALYVCYVIHTYTHTHRNDLYAVHMEGGLYVCHHACTFMEE